MKAFFESYGSHIVYVIIVLVIVGALLFLTSRLHKWLMKKEEVRFPGEKSTSIDLIKWVLNALWPVLGIIALSFIFVEKGDYSKLQDNFKLVLYLGFLAVSTVVSAALTNLWFKKSIRSKIENKEDPTAFKFLRYIAVLVICFVGAVFAMFAFPSMRVVAQTALGGAGIFAVVVGFASQEALANVVGGLFIISFKPFKIGDVVKVSDTMVGVVSDITLRHTVIRNYENKMIVIPNSIINKEKLINYDLGEMKCCEHIEIGISFDSNVVLAKKLMQEECENHPLIYDNRKELEKLDGAPVVKTALTKMNDSSVTIRAWAWAKDFDDAFEMRCEVLESIKQRFEAEGIEIAYPYRTIVMKKS
jgi:small-conductance mechanosensitive channel